MRDPHANPFADEARRAIWDMLVPRDIDAFLAADWSAVAEDFVDDGFVGVDARREADPDRWRLAFPSLGHYRAEWLRQAGDFARQSFAEDPRAAIFAATTLEDVEVAGGVALARKKFDGGIRRADGGTESMLWQTLYSCRVADGRWRICGFTGYLPNPMGR